MSLSNIIHYYSEKYLCYFHLPDGKAELHARLIIHILVLTF